MIGNEVLDLQGKDLIGCLGCSKRRFLRAEADLAAALGLRRREPYHWGRAIRVHDNLRFDCAVCTSDKYGTPSQRETVAIYSYTILCNTPTLETNVANHPARLGLGNTRPFVPQSSAQAAAMSPNNSIYYDINR